ncbi:hypothetical protein C9413_30565 [Rhizobium sp. SEMIA 4085]|uniref:hypothetical protein n=1 Tax=Rhizobium TaxID=379 RepID=UPI001478E049|nr:MULTISPECIES: hypothetical protein [Rhizobium]NNH33573.1 hypothetical protein [Rhizobium sp. SEMIA 4085]
MRHVPTHDNSRGHALPVAFAGIVLIGAYAVGLTLMSTTPAETRVYVPILAECAIPECGASPGATCSVNGEVVRMKVGPTVRCS